MRFTRDRRGQSVVVGTVILFGFLILALASYQAFAVPAQNNQAEFDHSQDLQSDMEDLRASLLDVRDARQNPHQRPVRVSLGTRYESRLFAVNPPPPDGALTTQNRGPIDIQDAQVDPDVSASYQNTEPLFDETHDTRLLTYRPNYNEYRNPPRTTFEHSLLYNRFDGANQTVTGQRTIDGDDQQITLTAYSGDVNRQGISTTIDPETLDGPTPTVPIESEIGDEFTVTLPTHSPSVWTELIGTTVSDGEPNAAVVDSTADSVTIELTGEWDLQMARVGYDGGTVAETPFSNVTRVDDERSDRNVSRTFNVEWDEPEPVRIVEEEEETLTVEVTDRDSGEPIDRASVDASFTRTAGSGTLTVDDDDLFTDESGQADVTVGAGEATAGDKFEMYASAGDDTDRISVSITSGTMAERTELVDGSGESFSQSQSGIRFDLENTGSEIVEIDEISVSDTSTNAINVRGPNDDTFTGGGGIFEGTVVISSDSESLTENATIADDTSESFELYQFRNNGRENMNNESVTIVLTFTDNSQLTFTVTS